MSTKMTSFRGEANWAEMTSHGGKLATLHTIPPNQKSKQRRVTKLFIYKH